MEKYRKNAAMIQIFYEELNFETLSETPAYSVRFMYSDLLTPKCSGIPSWQILAVY
jgi:hypothetical protein